MVSFATLILALVTGVVPVEVVVDAHVTSVEMRLDGDIVGHLHGEPWRLDVDFGDALQPHELVAVARDARGRELSRARQVVNLPRPPAEVTLSLQRGPDGRYRSARVSWEAVGDARVIETRVLFDGSPLRVASPERIELPPYDPSRQHYVVARVRFAGNLQAEAAIAVGGRFGDTAHSEITSLAVELRDGHDELPAGSLAGWFRKRGRPLDLTAVDTPPAAIFLVRDRSSEARLTVLGHGLRRWHVLFGRGRARDGVRRDDAVYLLDTVPRLADRRQRPALWLFPLSPDLARYRRHRGVTRVLSELRFGERNPGAPRPAQAVATAGLRAAGLGSPRVVVLVVGPTVVDSGLYGPDNVLGYLETLQVPFRLWVVGDEPAMSLAEAWGEPVSITDQDDLRAALADLRALLDRQRIVWVEGQHLPQQIELSAAAKEFIRFAGRPTRFERRRVDD